MCAVDTLPPVQTDESPEEVRRFFRLITEETGIKMSDAKIPMIRSRLMRRMRALGINSFGAYQKRLLSSQEGTEEFVHFINAVTTNKTDFFRERRHFDYLVETAIPKIPGQANRKRFLAWCAGCSSGEEPYTLSMVLSEYADSHRGFDFAVLATDISTKVLDLAKAGIYDMERIEPIPLPLRRKYLLKSKDPEKQLVRMAPEIRRRISFYRLNFMESDYRIRDTFQVIFFRNVMIYFDRPTQEAVVNRMCENLTTGGYLFIGHSESLSGLKLPLEPVAPAVYRKIQ